MYIVTTMSYDDLAQLIRDKQISLNNADLLFGNNDDALNKYFKDRLGYDGYVVGLHGRLNSLMAGMFTHLDRDLTRRVGEHGRVILEAEIDESDMLRYSVSGINAAADALIYGLPEDEVFETLDEANIGASEKTTQLEVICVPYIKSNSKIRVASLAGDIEFAVEGITLVRLRAAEK